MFGLFKKKKKPINELPISEAIIECERLGVENFGINLYIEDQILFQVTNAKHYTKAGLEVNNEDDLAVVHFFNKNKTLTLDTWESFKTHQRENEFLYFEEPKGVFNYTKNIGNIPSEIEKEIYQQMKLYIIPEGSHISIEYVGY